MSYTVDLHVPRTNIEMSSNPRSMIAQGDLPTRAAPNAPSMIRSKYMDVETSTEGSIEEGYCLNQDLYEDPEIGDMDDYF